MVDKSSNIKERILQLAEFKGISKETFFKDLGMTYGNFKGKSKETPINSNALADILSKYPEVNPDWILTGKGEMLRTDFDIKLERIKKLDGIIDPQVTRRFFEALNFLVEKVHFRSIDRFNHVYGLKYDLDVLYRHPDTTPLPYELFEVLVTKYRISPNWLLTGKGDTTQQDKDLMDFLDKMVEFSKLDPMSQILKLEEIEQLQISTSRKINLFERYYKEDPTEVQTLGDTRYMTISPLVSRNAFKSYIAHIDDLDFLEDLPKHAITSQALPFGVYRSFENTKAVNGYIHDAIQESAIVTGRRLERTSWRQGLQMKNDPFFVFVTSEDIFLAKIIDHDITDNTVILGDCSLESYTHKAINLDDIREIFIIHAVTDIRF